MNQIQILLSVSALLLLDYSLAFSMTSAPVTLARYGSFLASPSTSTCLFAEEEEEASSRDAPQSSNDDPSTDILNSPAFLKRKIDVLKSDIAKTEEDIAAAKQRLEEGKAEWGGQLDELQKEYQNIQVRLGDQQKKGGSMAIVQVAREALKVLDNFDRAFGVITAETESQKKIEEEYRTTYNEILTILADLGVEEVKTVGTEFDYEIHQAVMQKPSDEYEEGTVVEEFQKGFKLGDTLIRAAMVSVAA